MDTPLHFATLLSMLKMAQHLALAEAALVGNDQQRSNSKQSQGQCNSSNLLQPAAAEAAAFLTPPAMLQLRVMHMLAACNQQGTLQEDEQWLQEPHVGDPKPAGQALPDGFQWLLLLAQEESLGRFVRLASGVAAGEVGSVLQAG